MRLVNLVCDHQGAAARKDKRGNIMQDKNDPAADWAREEAYWRKQHSNQPYADKNLSYDDYAPAYRFGFEAAGKFADRDYDEVEESLASDWERAEPGSAIPWDTVRPAVRAAWERMSGVISPRDPDRGVRGSI
jgi:hypothetical protein